MATHTISEGSLIVLIGTQGSGKSTWADTQINNSNAHPATRVSSDELRIQSFNGLKQLDSKGLFQVLWSLAELRLKNGFTTIVDATNVSEKNRATIYQIAKRRRCPLYLVRFTADLDQCLANNAKRTGPAFVPEPEVRKTHKLMLATTEEQLRSEARRNKLPDYQLHLLTDADEVNIEFTPETKVDSRIDRRDLTGNFAIIGDVHGMSGELDTLLKQIDERMPDATIVFVGDLSHRGPDSVGAYRRALELIDQGKALLIDSNHGFADAEKLGRQRLQRGMTLHQAAADLRKRADDNPNQFNTAHVAKVAAQLVAAHDGEKLAKQIVAANQAAPAQLWLDEGRLLVVHGGVRPDLIGVDTNESRQIARYGTPKGTDPDSGYPLERDSWVTGYCAARDADPTLPIVVYGHIAYDDPACTEHTYGIDTGAGKHDTAALTALLWTDGKPAGMLSVPIGEAHAAAA